MASGQKDRWRFREGRARAGWHLMGKTLVACRGQISGLRALTQRIVTDVRSAESLPANCRLKPWPHWRPLACQKPQLACGLEESWTLKAARGRDRRHPCGLFCQFVTPRSDRSGHWGGHIGECVGVGMCLCVTRKQAGRRNASLKRKGAMPEAGFYCAQTMPANTAEETRRPVAFWQGRWALFPRWTPASRTNRRYGHGRRAVC